MKIQIPTQNKMITRGNPKPSVLICINGPNVDEVLIRLSSNSSGCGVAGFEKVVVLRPPAEHATLEVPYTAERRISQVNDTNLYVPVTDPVVFSN
jgi:hypothetical protein